MSRRSTYREHLCSERGDTDSRASGVGFLQVSPRVVIHVHLVLHSFSSEFSTAKKTVSYLSQNPAQWVLSETDG